MAVLDDTKLAMRLTTDAYNDEISSLIDAAQLDLGIAGVIIPSSLDELVKRAVITYVRLHFGTPEDYEHLKASYDEQKAQLQMATGYTNWGVYDD